MVEINKPELIDEQALADHEQNLIIRSVGGDIEGFTELVGLHQERVIRLAYSFVTNWEDAKDVAQETFVKAFKSIRDFQGDSTFATWIYRITVNQCKDMLRKKKVRKHLSVFIKSDEKSEEPLEHKMLSQRVTEKEVLNGELRNKINIFVGKLPNQQKTVFILRYFEGFELKEIAVTLNLSVGAVKAHLWQAVQKVRNKLGQYLELGE